jgi:VanZ family protein
VTDRARKTLRWAAVAYTVLLAAASLMPSGSGPLKGWDDQIAPTTQDALHAPAYAGLVMLWVPAWSSIRRMRPGAIVVIALLCAVFGAAMELAQLRIPGRTCSLSDGLVNVGGAALGMLVMLGWRKWRGARPS